MSARKPKPKRRHMQWGRRDPYYMALTYCGKRVPMGFGRLTRDAEQVTCCQCRRTTIFRVAVGAERA